MKNNKKPRYRFLRFSFSAFTMMELIITLIIGGLVIAAASGLIISFSSWNGRQGREVEKYNKLLQFYKAIEADMQMAVAIRHYDDETIFEIQEGSEISYKIEYGIVIRSVNETSDTFSMNVKNWYMTKDRETGLPLLLQILKINELQDVDTFLILKKYENEQLFNKSEIENFSDHQIN